ncbi:uroporphyrinogen-III synthase [Microbaculum marinum]|uniref:Uroporphyrinogen-III synthase n=1 Tax=Microbaculum marinum TaxID=1764581 RepID=A0AAW9RMM4_9HYPH
MTVLVTRPAADARRTIGKLARMGIDAIAAPALDIVPVDRFEVAERPAALLLTSANAVAAIAARPDLDRLRQVPTFAVGDRTADAARQAGFRDVRSAGGDAGDLAALVRLTLEAGGREPGRGPVVYLSGRDVSADLDEDLRRAGYRCERVVVYEARPAADLPDAVKAAISQGMVSAILFHSARSALAFGAITERTGLSARLARVPAVVLSEGVRTAAASCGFMVVAVAEAPNERALLAALEGLVKARRQQ